MKPDRSAYKKGDLVYGEAQPGKLFDKREMITKGMFLTSDCMVPTTLVSSAPRYGTGLDLSDIGRRIDAAQQKADVLLAALRKSRASP